MNFLEDPTEELMDSVFTVMDCATRVRLMETDWNIMFDLFGGTVDRISRIERDTVWITDERRCGYRDTVPGGRTSRSPVCRCYIGLRSGRSPAASPSPPRRSRSTVEEPGKTDSTQMQQRK